MLRSIPSRTSCDCPQNKINYSRRYHQERREEVMFHCRREYLTHPIIMTCRITPYPAHADLFLAQGTVQSGMLYTRTYAGVSPCALVEAVFIIDD